MFFWTMFGVGVLGVGALILAVDLRSSRKLRERLANGEPDNRRRDVTRDPNYNEALLRANPKPPASGARH